MKTQSRYEALIDSNINASQTPDVKEFFILIGGFFGLFIILFLICEFSVNLYITNMPTEKQVQLEHMIAQAAPQINTIKPEKYPRQMAVAEAIKRRIMYSDKNLYNRSSLDLYIADENEVNAYVTPDGKIYFTKGLLNEVKDSNELAFILAHEIGHYSNKHHLKAISRNIILISLAAVMGQDVGIQKTISSISGFEGAQYSKGKEREADLYANRFVKSIYGTNEGGIRFFRFLKEKEKYPQFLYYFSTHPSPDERIKLLQSY